MVAFRGRRRPPPLFVVVGLALSWQAVARAGGNDLNLLNLCVTGNSGTQTMPVLTNSCAMPGSKDYDDAQSRYRSLMSELGVVVAPRLMTPADTLGYAGFQFSAELGITTINNTRTVNGDSSGIPYWDGIQAVPMNDLKSVTPPSSLTTVGGFVRKGLWFPIPAVEFGAGAVDVIGSSMYAIQGYAKIALQEGFHDWVLPSFAVRGSASQLLGTSQVNLTVWGVDVLISKAFSLGGTARAEPYFGWNALFIDARSGVIDGTPTCDAYAQDLTPPGPSPPAGSGCYAVNNGTWNDLANNFTFKSESIITRYRWSLGVKLKLSVVFLTAEGDYIQAGSSHDSTADIIDSSGSQYNLSLATGLDF